MRFEPKEARHLERKKRRVSQLGRGEKAREQRKKQDKGAKIVGREL